MLTLSLALPSLGSQPPVGGEDGMQRGAAGVLAGHVGFAGVLAGVLAVLEDMLAMKKLLD